MSEVRSSEPSPGQQMTMAEKTLPPGELPATVLAADRTVTQKLGEVAPALRWFGDYELLEEVARGGMGVVYRARQLDLNRVVALKMILAGRLADGDDVVRFRTEAEAAARLQHPNIVAVHEVGEVEGQHYFTMEFIDGSSLAQRLTQGPLPGKLAARYLKPIARAMHYAHKQGILHRDLKPSNILVDGQDEPHITDFGLAKKIDSDHGFTRTGAVLGTPSYMAPEQASGKTREIGPSCDIYGMGAVLYELLTGRPPFKAESPLDTVLQVIHNDPVPPRLLNPNIDADLETICLKCLEKDPKDRYLTAEDLAQDLELFLEGESITARSFNILDRLTRTFERSQENVASFHTWSTMLLIMAVVVFAEHLAVFVMLEFDQPRWQILLARSAQFFLLIYLFWHNRGNRLLPTTGAERELWTIWIGYFLAYGSVLLITRALPSLGVVQVGPNAPDHAEEVLPYPFISLLAGLAFFFMGSNYWGRCYAFGLAFFACAIFMPLHPTWAPLEFGLVWTVALVSLGVHLRRLGQSMQNDPNLARALVEPATQVYQPAAKSQTGQGAPTTGP